jgi:hypothetical protein
LCISLIYNPYSIVNERIDAKISAEHNALRFVTSADVRFVFCGGRRPPILREVGGADRVRTDDPLLAKQVLSQRSYSPGSIGRIED